MKENTSLELTRIRVHIYGPRHDTRYNLDTLARLAGIQPGLVSRYVRLGLLDPVEDCGELGLWFDDGSLHSLRKIERLRRELGVNIDGAGVILELLRRIEELEQEISRLRGEL